jgi:glycosyltransferase involved in cell wall biosynthesis
MDMCYNVKRIIIKSLILGKFEKSFYKKISIKSTDIISLLMTIHAIENTKNVTQIHLSIIIPVFNLERSISIMIQKTKEVFHSTPINYEMVFVNDGSQDNTLEILKKEQALDPRIRIISYPKNRGKGYAIRTGMMLSQGDMAMFIDGDLEISPNSMVLTYLNELQDSDLIIASKRHYLSKVNIPKSRDFLSRVFNLLVRIFIGIKIKDTQSGLKVGRGDTLRRIFGIMQVDRYTFDVELLLIASLLQLRINEMPVEMRINGHLRIYEITKMLRDLIVISYRYRIRRWYQKQLKLQ